MGASRFLKDEWFSSRFFEKGKVLGAPRKVHGVKVDSSGFRCAWGAQACWGARELSGRVPRCAGVSRHARTCTGMRGVHGLARAYVEVRRVALERAELCRYEHVFFCAK